MDVILTIAGYFLIMNILGFSLMGIDKWKDKKGAFRIPESTLFIIALIGGSTVPLSECTPSATKPVIGILCTVCLLS